MKLNTINLLFNPKWLVIILLCFITWFFPPTVEAKDFSVKSLVTYTAYQDGHLHTEHKIKLDNLSPLIYAKNYILTYEDLDLSNLTVFDKDEPYRFEKISDNRNTKIEIYFPGIMAGLGKTREFTISFDIYDMAVKSGEIWEIRIPKISDIEIFDEYNIILNVPKSFGKLSFISPDPKQLKDKTDYYSFEYDKYQLKDKGINAGFGDFQLFNFKINYHLDNPITNKIFSEIALPPDTAFQVMYYNIISPEPVSMRLDGDGNWLAGYEINPRQQLDITAEGTVKILSQPNTKQYSSLFNRQDLLKRQPYWEVDDQKIKSLAASVKNPKDIYNLVIDRLGYNYDGINPPIVRKGAAKALEFPNQALCMEYTDLFIAIARQKGIPAREINGYAYTEDRNVQPLSLVTDILHAWPEYWNEDKNTWIPVDPTWGDTTSGQDFFNNFDLRHFTFVIHGLDSSKPYSAGSYKLGVNPEKDVYINFGNIPLDYQKDLKITGNISSFDIFKGFKIKLKITNKGKAAEYNKIIEVFFDNKYKDSIEIKNIIPYMEATLDYNVPFAFFGNKAPAKIEFKLLSQNIEIKNIRFGMILISLLFISVICLTLILAYYFLTKFSKIVKKRSKTNNAPAG